MIPKEKIEDWKQLCKQATPGPYIEFFSHGKVSALMPAGRPGEICSFGEDAVVPNRDARFYRTAREAVPALIEEVEKLRARVEELEKGSNDLCISFDRPEGAGGEYGGKSVGELAGMPHRLLLAVSNKQGWTLDYKQILKISELTRNLECVSLEETEAVMLAMVDAGFAHIEEDEDVE